MLLACSWYNVFQNRILYRLRFYLSALLTDRQKIKIKMIEFWGNTLFYFMCTSYRVIPGKIFLTLQTFIIIVQKMFKIPVFEPKNLSKSTAP